MESIKAYLKELRTIPLLKPEEEIELAIKIKSGDEEARKKMIRSNLRIVVNIAKRYIHFGVPFMDLIEEGNMGLMKAVNKFDPKRGFRFSTYAAWWIRQSISRAVSEQSRLIRIPVYMNEMLIKWKRAKEQLSQKLGRTPTSSELAKFLDVTAEKIRQINSWVTKTSSLEAPIGEEGEDQVKDLIEDTNIAAPDTELSKLFDRERLVHLLRHMTEREQKILNMRFGLKSGKPQTLAQIAKKLRVSRERIRQIEEVAIRKLRKFADTQEK